MCHSIAVKTSSKINILLSSSDSSTIVLGIDDEDLNTYKILVYKTKTTSSKYISLSNNNKYFFSFLFFFFSFSNLCCDPKTLSQTWTASPHSPYQ